MSAGDVIFACATASGQAGVAVIRVSGVAAGDLFPVLTGQSPPAARRASLRRLINPSDSAMLDQALTLWFPAPHSFTGENTVELHVHGGTAVITGVMEALAGIVWVSASGARRVHAQGIPERQSWTWQRQRAWAI